MKLNEKAQQVVEYLLLITGIVAGVIGAAGPFRNAVQYSLNRAESTIYQSYTWRTGNPSNCSTPKGCGIGKATRSVWCQRDDDKATVADAYCQAQAGSRPDETVECNAGACGDYNWVGSGWGPCSAPCGGTQTQSVVCKDLGGATVNDTFCADKGPKPVSQSCGIPVCYNWEESHSCITLCSNPCGTGTCQQQVTCIDNLTKATTADAHCLAISSKPSNAWSCDTGATCGYQWITGGWGSCQTATPGCGTGTKTQTVTCVRVNDGSTVPDSNCGDPASRPKDHDTCDLGSCYNWYLDGGWGACTTICNTPTSIGTQTATLVCKDRGGNVVDNTNCASLTPPAVTQNCPGNPDCTYSWGNTQWSVCSSNCGSGTQTRDVWCTRTNDNTRMPDVSECVRTNGPRSASQDCTGGCYKWVTSTWSACDNTCGDGKHTRTYTCQSSGVIVDNSNCLNSVGEGSAGSPPITSEDCTDTSGCCGNGFCDSGYVGGVWVGETCSTCSRDCGACCVPSCVGKCGGVSDGCGGTCNATCCTPSCAGKCGGVSDGCGGTCNTTCCTPSCEGKCGGVSDGCGGTCNATCPTPAPPTWKHTDSDCITVPLSCMQADVVECPQNRAPQIGSACSSGSTCYTLTATGPQGVIFCRVCKYSCN